MPSLFVPNIALFPTYLSFFTAERLVFWKFSHCAHNYRFRQQIKLIYKLFALRLSKNTVHNYHICLFLFNVDYMHILNPNQGLRWASPMSPSAIFNFIWRQNTVLGDFFGDNILFIKNYFVLLSINGAGKKHRLLERASWWQIIKTGNKSVTSDC